MTHASVLPAPAARQSRPTALARWLWAVALLVIIVVGVGGITRLTESGLSITEWRPVSGVLPPLSEAGWIAEFEKYKQIPNIGKSTSA
jgi:cytochrome c oxidase assembly protein subunit 15